MAVAIAYGSRVSGTVSGNSATASGLDFDAESSDRIVVAAIGYDLPATISSVTIGGEAAALLASAANTNLKVAYYGVALPTGTSGDVVISITVANGNVLSVASFAVTGADITPTDSDSTGSTGDVISITALTIPTDGAGIVSSVRNTSGNTVTWSGASEQHDTSLAGFQHSSALVTAIGTNTISSDALISDATLTLGVAFGPASGGATTTAVELDPASYAFTANDLGVSTKRVVTLSPASFAYTANDLTVNVVQATTYSVELLPAAFVYTPGALEVTATGQTTTDTHDGIGPGDPFRRKRRPKKGKREKAVEDLLKKLMGLVPDDPPPEIEAEVEIAQASVERVFAPTVNVTPDLEALQFAQLQLAKLEAMLNRYLEDEEDIDDLLLMAA